MFTFITGFAAFGVYQARRNIQQREESDLENVFDMSDVADFMSDPLRIEDAVPVPYLIPGYGTIFERLGSEVDESGHQWNHYAVNHTHRDSGYQFASKMKHNKVSPDPLPRRENRKPTDDHQDHRRPRHPIRRAGPAFLCSAQQESIRHLHRVLRLEERRQCAEPTDRRRHHLRFGRAALQLRQEEQQVSVLCRLAGRRCFCWFLAPVDRWQLCSHQWYFR
jgi:hypothetical protein